MSLTTIAISLSNGINELFVYSVIWIVDCLFKTENDIGWSIEQILVYVIVFNDCNKQKTCLENIAKT